MKKNFKFGLIFISSIILISSPIVLFLNSCSNSKNSINKNNEENESDEYQEITFNDNHDYHTLNKENMFASNVTDIEIKELVISKRGWFFNNGLNINKNFLEENLSISNILSNDYEGIVNFKCKLNNSDGKGKSISKDLYFSGFKLKYYSISFNSKSIYNYGISSKLASSKDQEWIKNQIIDNINEFFILNDIPSNYNWNSNLSINIISSNDLKGELSFQVSLVNSSNNSSNDSTISKIITFTGFLKSTPPVTPTYSIIFNNPTSNLYINNSYTLTTTLSPSDLSNAYYEFSCNRSDINMTPNESEVIIKPISTGSYTITVNVYRDLQKSELIASNSITINVNNYELEVIPNSSYDTFTTNQLSVNVAPYDSNYIYQWTCDNPNLTLTNSDTKTVSFTSNISGNYKLSVNVYNQNNDLLASKNNIIINFIDASYSIDFKQQSEFAYGTYDKIASDQSINETWIKNKVIDNKNDFFEIPSNIPINFNWSNNVIIENLQANENDCYITFNLKLNNANNNKTSINKTIKFTGFKDPNNNNQSGYYTIEFQDNISTFDYGDPNILPSSSYSYVKTKVIENKERFFKIPPNIPSNFDWDKNIKIDIFTSFNDQGKCSFLIYLGDSSNDPSNLGFIRSNTIIFTGFKKGVAYDIKFDSTTDKYPFGDPNVLASDSSIDDNWIIQKVIENKNKIFTYGKLPDGYSWEDNLSVNWKVCDESSRSITFNITLYNSNNNKGSIDKTIIFNDFKEKQWTTSQMPSDSELLINQIKKPNGTINTGSISVQNAINVLNKYGVTRSFALVNKIVSDSLFNDLSFNNVSVSMTNINFNTLTFVISGTSTQSISNWGQKKIPVSSIIESWSGATINTGDNVELTIKYDRNSSSRNRGSDIFDSSQITWLPNVWGTNTIRWREIDVDYKMYTTEFSSWASVKVNNKVIKQSSSADNRVFFMFVNHYNGNDYLIQSSSILNSYYRNVYDFKRID